MKLSFQHCSFLVVLFVCVFSRTVDSHKLKGKVPTKVMKLKKQLFSRSHHNIIAYKLMLQMNFFWTDFSAYRRNKQMSLNFEAFISFLWSPCNNQKMICISYSLRNICSLIIIWPASHFLPGLRTCVLLFPSTHMQIIQIYTHYTSPRVVLASHIANVKLFTIVSTCMLYYNWQSANNSTAHTTLAPLTASVNMRMRVTLEL